MSRTSRSRPSPVLRLSPRARAADSSYVSARSRLICSGGVSRIRRSSSPNRRPARERQRRQEVGRRRRRESRATGASRRRCRRVASAAAVAQGAWSAARGRVCEGAEAEDRFPQGRVREPCPREPVDGQMEPEPPAHDARASPRRCMSAETTAAARSFHPGANTRFAAPGGRGYRHDAAAADATPPPTAGERGEAARPHPRSRCGGCSKPAPGRKPGRSCTRTSSPVGRKRASASGGRTTTSPSTGSIRRRAGR